MNKNKKLNENGFAHLSLIVIIILSIAVVGLAGYRVNEARKASRSKAAEVTDTQKSEIDNNSAKQDELAEETLPEEQSTVPEEKTEQPSAQQPSTQKPQDSQDTPSQSPSPAPTEPRQIFFTKGGQSADGDYVDMTHIMTEAHSGTCKFTFKLNGTVRVEKTTQISSSKACSISIPKSEFPKSAEYMESTRFDSSDGSVFAETNPFGILII